MIPFAYGKAANLDIPKAVQKWDLWQRENLEIKRSKASLYYNMGMLSIVKPQGLLFVERKILKHVEYKAAYCLKRGPAAKPPTLK